MINKSAVPCDVVLQASGSLAPPAPVADEKLTGEQHNQMSTASVHISKGMKIATKIKDQAQEAEGLTEKAKSELTTLLQAMEEMDDIHDELNYSLKYNKCKATKKIMTYGIAKALMEKSCAQLLKVKQTATALKTMLPKDKGDEK